MVPALRSPHDREIIRLAVPALGALAAEPLYILVDTAIVGHLGTSPLAGLAVAGTVLTATFAIFNFLAYSTTGSVARQVGAGNRRAAAELGVDSLWLATGLGLALTHDVANRHGGQLRLAPSEVGATFELVLPAIEDPGQRKD